MLGQLYGQSPYRLLKDLISVSSDSSEAFQEGSDYTPRDTVAASDEETETDVEIIEKPPKKRIRGFFFFPSTPGENDINDVPSTFSTSPGPSHPRVHPRLLQQLKPRS